MLGRVTCLSNLRSHLQKCETKNKSMPIIQFANFVPKNCDVHQKDLDKMKILLAKYVAGTLSSFLSVENEHLLNLIQFGIELGAKYGAIDVKSVAYSRQAVKKTITSLVNDVQTQIKELFKQPNAFCLTSDIWTDSKNHNSFLDVTAFYFDKNSELKHILIAFK